MQWPKFTIGLCVGSRPWLVIWCLGVIFSKVKSLAWEGKLDLFFFEALHNLQVDPLVHFVICPVIRRLNPVAHIYIERPVVKIAKIHSWRPFRVAVYLRHAGQHLFYYFISQTILKSTSLFFFPWPLSIEINSTLVKQGNFFNSNINSLTNLVLKAWPSI